MAVKWARRHPLWAAGLPVLPSGLVVFAITVLVLRFVCSPNGETPEAVFQGGWLRGPELQAGRSEASAFVLTSGTRTFLYVAGGEAECCHPAESVERAEILPSGRLGEFEDAPSLPEARTSASAVVDQGWVFLVGGTGPSGQGTQSILRAQVDAATGNLGLWEAVPEETTRLPSPTTGAGVFAHNGFLYVVGGTCGALGPGCPSAVAYNTVERARITAPGLLSEFETLPWRLTKPRSPRQHTVVLADSVFNFGGAISGPALATDAIERAELLPGGEVGPWGQVGVLPSAAGGGAALAVAGEVAVIGGHGAVPGESSRAAVEAPAASPMSFFSGPSLAEDAPRSGFAAAVHGDRVYLVGGDGASAGTQVAVLTPEQVLADRFAPILALAKDDFEPEEAQIMFNEPARKNCTTALLDSGGDPDDVVCPNANDLAATSSPVSFIDILGAVVGREDAYVEKYRSVADSYDAVAYTRIRSDGGELLVDYWFFYYYDFFHYLPFYRITRSADHEGDWERVQVRFAAQSAEDALVRGVQPKGVRYSQHICDKDTHMRSRSWGKVLKQGTHAIAFVSVGSHANYFDLGLALGSRGFRSFLQGDCTVDDQVSSTKVLVPAPIIIDCERPAEDQQWLLFKGTWGEAKKARGPCDR